MTEQRWLRIIPIMLKDHFWPSSVPMRLAAAAKRVVRDSPSALSTNLSEIG